MCMNIEIASIRPIFEICIVPEPATTPGTGLLLDRDTGIYVDGREKISSFGMIVILSRTHAYVLYSLVVL